MQANARRAHCCLKGPLPEHVFWIFVNRFKYLR
jgi:hypothetical protein